jgi:hypothetical protein
LYEILYLQAFLGFNAHMFMYALSTMYCIIEVITFAMYRNQCNYFYSKVYCTKRSENAFLDSIFVKVTIKFLGENFEAF